METRDAWRMSSLSYPLDFERRQSARYLSPGPPSICVVHPLRETATLESAYRTSMDAADETALIRAALAGDRGARNTQRRRHVSDVFAPPQQP